MLGSTVVAPIFVCVMIYFAPESPRWYMSKGRVGDAFKSMRKLRHCDLQASRDLFYIAKLLEIENKSAEGRNLLADMWNVPRVRRAAQASGLVMFMQQFCGVNVCVPLNMSYSRPTGSLKSICLFPPSGHRLLQLVSKFSSTHLPRVSLT